MRYTEIELQCEDLLWFAVDIKGNIVAFTSGGAGCVPEFVVSSKENTEDLSKYFNSLKEKSNDCEDEFSAKGLFYFDVSYEDNYGNSYYKVSSPTKPLHIDDLPDNIQKLLYNNKIDFDANTSDSIKIKHAY